MAKKYTPLQEENALKTLVLVNGNISKAVERLEAAGEAMPRRTLSDLRNAKADLYEKLEANRESWLATEQAEAFDFLAVRAIDAQLKAIGEFMRRGDDEMAKVKTAELSTLAKNFSVVSGVAIDKSRILRELPTQITESRDIAGIARAIRAKFPGVVSDDFLNAIEGKARERRDDDEGEGSAPVPALPKPKGPTPLAETADDEREEAA